MQFKRRTFAFILVMFLLLPVMVRPVRADAEEPLCYTFTLSNLPEGTAYVDMLIPLEESDPMYVSLAEENLPEGLTAQAQIVGYSQDGYRSYTFHYQDAKSSICVQSAQPQVYFFTDGSDNSENYLPSHMYDIESRTHIRLAALDEQGNILLVSEPLRTDTSVLFASRNGKYHFDAAANSLASGFSISSAAVFVFICLCIFILLLSCFAKWLFAILFGLRKRYDGVVIAANCVSQLSQRVLYVVLYSAIFFHTPYAVIALPILGILGETVLYLKKMADVPRWKCLLYILTANAVSIGISLLSIRSLFD